MEKCIVIGLGVFGYTLALKLVEMGAEVVAVDRALELVEKIQDMVAYSLSMDTTDEKALSELKLPDFDSGIVCIGEDFEANLLTSVLLKNGGVKRVISRASNPLHIKILKAVGIDEVITPGAEAASRLAFSLLHRSVQDIIQLDANISVAKVQVPESLIGKSIGAINLRAKYGLNVVSINRSETIDGVKHENSLSNPGADAELKEGDILVVIGSPENVGRLAQR